MRIEYRHSYSFIFDILANYNLYLYIYLLSPGQVEATIAMSSLPFCLYKKKLELFLHPIIIHCLQMINNQTFQSPHFHSHPSNATGLKCSPPLMEY